MVKLKLKLLLRLKNGRQNIEIQIGTSYDFMNYEENKGVLINVKLIWHKSKGFVGNVRGGEASLYNFDCGKICDIYHNFFDEEEKIDEVLYD